jgi:hypothetical protein
MNILNDIKDMTVKIEEGKDVTMEEVYSLLIRCFIEFTSVKNKQVIDSWKNDPDRMGGQFTEEEINRSHEWK